MSKAKEKKVVDNEWMFMSKDQRLIPFFKELKENESLDEKSVVELYEMYKGDKSTLNNLKINIRDKSTYPSFFNEEYWKGSEKITSENVYDLLQHVGIKKRANSWIKLIPGKVRSLVKSNQEEFENIITSFSDESSYKKFLLKSSRYKKYNDFINNLKIHINAQGLSISSVYNEIMDTIGADIHYMEDDLIIAVIYTAEASSKLGSRSWCISTGGSYWSSYVERDGNVQYFIWDYKIEKSNSKHKIGVTMSKNGITAAHDNSDLTAMSFVKGKSYIKKLVSFKQLPEITKIKYCVLNDAFDDKYNLLGKLRKDDIEMYIEEFPHIIKKLKLSKYKDEWIVSKIILSQGEILELPNVSKWIEYKLDSTLFKKLYDNIGSNIFRYKCIADYVISELTHVNYLKYLTFDWSEHKLHSSIISDIRVKVKKLSELVDNKIDLYNLLMYSKVLNKYKRTDKDFDVVLRDQYKNDKNKWDIILTENDNLEYYRVLLQIEEDKHREYKSGMYAYIIGLDKDNSIDKVIKYTPIDNLSMTKAFTYYKINATNSKLNIYIIKTMRDMIVDKLSSADIEYIMSEKKEVK